MTQAALLTVIVIASGVLAYIQTELDFAIVYVGAAILYMGLVLNALHTT